MLDAGVRCDLVGALCYASFRKFTGIPHDNGEAVLLLSGDHNANRWLYELAETGSRERAIGIAEEYDKKNEPLPAASS
jgi:hypothetical protein